MIVLSLDTTTRSGSVAVARDGVVVLEWSGNPAVTHGERLPLDLRHALDEASVTVGEVDLLAVAAGPGSFTGIRVGIAAMQGLAMALETRIVPVSALEALARLAADGRVAVAPWMDAQRGEVFAAVYDPSGRELLIEPISARPSAVLPTWSRSGWRAPLRFIGDGALRYASEIVSAIGPDADIVTTVPSLAGTIAKIATETPDRAVAPHAVVPIYIRRPDPELAKEKRGIGS
jgi:tRNA threonylcarbamoyladenosine biosynthesis protein TsaB